MASIDTNREGFAAKNYLAFQIIERGFGKLASRVESRRFALQNAELIEIAILLPKGLAELILRRRVLRAVVFMKTRIISNPTLRRSAGYSKPSSTLHRSSRLGPLLLVFLAGAFVPHLSAQSASGGFVPSVAGTVEAITTQPDGKILIGGSFWSVGGLPRTNVARLNSDGSLDLSFDAGLVGPVRKVEASPDGSIVVGGSFGTLGGQPRKVLGKVDSTGALDPLFIPNLDVGPFAMAVQPDGKVIVGGQFTMAGGQPRAYIARFHTDGSLDAEFDPQPNGVVYNIVVQRDGTILVVGYFTLLGGQPHGYIGRLNPDGSVDHSFNAQANALVRSVAVQPDGRLVVVGAFFTMNGQLRTRIARLHGDGSLDTAFVASADNLEVHTVAVQTDGKILLGGDFAALNGQPRSRIGRLNADGSLDTAFNPSANHIVRVVAIHTDGKILVGGAFTMLAGQSRTGLGWLNPDGSPPATFDPGAAGGTLVNAFAVQPDHTITVGGYFTSLGGQACTNLGRLTADGRFDARFARVGPVTTLIAQPDGKVIVAGLLNNLGNRTNIGRLNSDGTLDAGFTASVESIESTFPNLQLLCLAAQADGKVLVSGSFDRVNDVARTNLARLNPDGSLDTTFRAGTVGSYSIQSVAVQADGKIVVGGSFRILAGQARTNLGRLNADGSLDEAFHPAANGTVWTVALQADGKILVGGEFTQLGGQPRSSLGRLNPDGSVDMDFNPGVGMIDGAGTPRVFSLALQADGKILVGGDFTTVNRQPRNRIARLAADGTLESAFLSGANGIVFGLAIQADGNILVGGIFSLLAGESRSGIARLVNDTPALDTLAINPSGTEVIWTRGGSATEIEQVSFEQSLDGTTYTALGSGKRISGGWRLAGLALPAGQNIYIRARGRSIGGYHGGSSSLLESVAQYWRLPPPMISSAQVVGGGAFQFSFANTNAANFSVLASTDVAAPVGEWEVLGPPVPVGNGVYQFTDPGAANHPRRFYQLRFP